MDDMTRIETTLAADVPALAALPKGALYTKLGGLLYEAISAERCMLDAITRQQEELTQLAAEVQQGRIPRVRITSSVERITEYATRLAALKTAYTEAVAVLKMTGQA